MTEAERQKLMKNAFAIMSACCEMIEDLNKCPAQGHSGHAVCFREGQRVRHKRNGDRGIVMSDGIRRAGDSYSSAWIQSDWELDV